MNSPTALVLSSEAAVTLEESESNLKDFSWSNFSEKAASFSSKKVWRMMPGLNSFPQSWWIGSPWSFHWCCHWHEPVHTLCKRWGVWGREKNLLGLQKVKSIVVKLPVLMYRTYRPVIKLYSFTEWALSIKIMTFLYRCKITWMQQSTKTLLTEDGPVSTHERPGSWYEVTEAVIWKFRKSILSPDFAQD